MGEQSRPAPKAIELRIESISQLFHTLDRFPFREKDLDKDVEEFIETDRDLSVRLVAGGSWKTPGQRWCG